MHTHSEALHKVQAGELWLTYLLYALTITAPVAVLLSIAKTIQYHRLLDQGDRTDAQELQMLTDHYDWLNRTTLVTILLGMMALGTLYYFFGYLFAVAAVVWWFYRIGRGVASLIEYKSPPIAA